MTLSAQPSSGGSVSFTIQASESDATGPLSYQLAYGDGSSDQNVVPDFCQSGSGSPENDTWDLSHTYTSRGTYTVQATVKANCTTDQASPSLTVTIS